MFVFTGCHVEINCLFGLMNLSGVKDFRQNVTSTSFTQCFVWLPATDTLRSSVTSWLSYSALKLNKKCDTWLMSFIGFRRDPCCGILPHSHLTAAKLRCHETPHRRQIQVLGIGKMCLCGAYYWFPLRKGTGHGFHAFLTCILLLLLLIQCKNRCIWGRCGRCGCFVSDTHGDSWLSVVVTVYSRQIAKIVR